MIAILCSLLMLGGAYLIHRTGTRRATAAAAVLVLAASLTFAAGALQSKAGAAEDGFACKLEGIGVGLSYVSIGLAAPSGPGVAVAGASAATASAAWAHACPRTIAGLLGAPPVFVFHHDGCLKVRITRMHDMPLRWCWSHVRTIREWRRIMQPRVGAYSAALYAGKL